MASLFERFSNTELGHRTAQVGSDGSQKLPQRITVPALSKLERREVPQLICLTVAAFLACTAPRNGSFARLAADVKDPLRPTLARLADASTGPRSLVDAVFDSTDLLSDRLTEIEDFRHRVAELLDVIERAGVEAAVLDAMS
jgi:fructuronate reductase